MLTSFVPLAVAGGVLRLGVVLLLRWRSAFVFCVPQLLAGALVVLAGLPDMLQPVPFPVPLGFAVGFLLPDLVLARRS